MSLLIFSACGNKVQFVEKEPLKDSALVYIYIPVHVSASDGTSSTDYAIRINNKPTLQRVEEGEFVSFNLKAEAMTISATKQEVMEKVLNMDLKAGQIYYLKIVDDMAAGDFEFFEVLGADALKEIAQTGEAGTNVESADNIINVFTDDDKKDEVVKTQTMTEAEVDAMIEKKLSEKTTAQATAVSSASAPSSNSVPLIAPISDTPKVEAKHSSVKKATTSQTDEIMKAYEMKEKGILSDAEFKAIKANILNK